MNGYAHEDAERRPSAYPMNTQFPALAVCVCDPECGCILAPVTRYFEQRGVSWELAQQNGWYPTDAVDCYRRVVIPAVTHKAGHKYWQARDVTGKANIRYQSPRGPRHEALVRMTPLCTPKGIVIVEGPFDALAAAGEGYYGIALMGMLPSQATLYHLALLVEELPVVVALDRDSTNEALRITTWLASQKLNVRTARLPGPEKDLAACLPQRRRALLKAWFEPFNLKSSHRQMLRALRA